MALTVMGIVLFYDESVSVLVRDGSIKLENLYTSFFDLFSVFSAFLFGFYVFVRSDGSEFLIKFKNTKSHKVFIKYLLHGTTMCALAILVCIPLIVVEPKPTGSDDLWFKYIILWIGFSTYSLTSAFRATVIFAVISSFDVLKPVKS